MKKIAIIVGIINVIIMGSFYYKLNNSFKKVEEIKIEKDHKENVEVEDYLIGVVGCEMPASFNMEALKAQAVAARTYLYNEINNNKTITDDDQCYNSKDELREKWQDKFDEYYNKISSAVKETSGEVMNKEGSLFKSYYFSTSNGYTESSTYVFNEVLLDSVESSWDKKVNNYEVKKEFSYSELKNILGDFKNIEIKGRNNTNHVDKVIVDSKTYSGIEFRKLLGLRSTDFDIDYNNGIYTFTTRGYGHGVGMSQYGANYLASINKTYQEILDYYYQNIKIIQI